jgi:hypothetical protein
MGTLLPAASRLTLLDACAALTQCLSENVGTSADAAGKSACATSLHPNTCEKYGLVAVDFDDQMDRRDVEIDDDP